MKNKQQNGFKKAKHHFRNQKIKEVLQRKVQNQVLYYKVLWNYSPKPKWETITALKNFLNAILVFEEKRKAQDSQQDVKFDPDKIDVKYESLDSSPMFVEVVEDSEVESLEMVQDNRQERSKGKSTEFRESLREDMYLDDVSVVSFVSVEESVESKMRQNSNSLSFEGERFKILIKQLKMENDNEQHVQNLPHLDNSNSYFSFQNHENYNSQMQPQQQQQQQQYVKQQQEEEMQQEEYQHELQPDQAKKQELDVLKIDFDELYLKQKVSMMLSNLNPHHKEKIEIQEGLRRKKFIGEQENKEVIRMIESQIILKQESMKEQEYRIENIVKYEGQWYVAMLRNKVQIVLRSLQLIKQSPSLAKLLRQFIDDCL